MFHQLRFEAAIIASVVLGLSFSPSFARADVAQVDDGAYLDTGFKHAPRPVRDASDDLLTLFRDIQLTRSDTLATLAKQTPVRSQASRGTCSIFSATAMLESMLIITGKGTTALDLSEEWLEYLVTRQSGSDGSSSTRNFGAIAKHGTVEEEVWPYVGVTWKSANDSALAKERCGKLEGTTYLAGCLVAHRHPRLLETRRERLLDSADPLFDPEFVHIRDRATSFKREHLESLATSGGYYVGKTSAIKALLAEGIPLALDIDFYYGAWNHRTADSLGIGRNMEHWAKGIVGYPEEDSMDYVKTNEDPAGHSVLVVGYDDNIEITTTYLADDGVTKKTGKYKGVYYFKNSWGTGSFGTQTVIDGKIVPGYGMITQKYAEEQGGFYRLPLK